MERRTFLRTSGGLALALAGGPAVRRAVTPGSALPLFLCGDVMTGRGIDQILPVPR